MAFFILMIAVMAILAALLLFATYPRMDYSGQQQSLMVLLGIVLAIMPVAIVVVMQ